MPFPNDPRIEDELKVHLRSQRVRNNNSQLSRFRFDR